MGVYCGQRGLARRVQRYAGPLPLSASQIAAAADLWERGFDTIEIAREIDALERDIYAAIEQIKVGAS